jgi:hypothetical protein
MKKTYKIKATKRAWMEIEADANLSQQEIYELAKKKATNGKLKWEDPSFNIIEITIDNNKEMDAKTKISLLKAIDPLTGKIKGH